MHDVGLGLGAVERGPDGRRGLGRALVRAAERHGRATGRALLTVKNLAPRVESDEYGRTRAFYEAMGFRPVEVFPTLWGEANPCLLMAKPLG